MNGLQVHGLYVHGLVFADASWVKTSAATRRAGTRQSRVSAELRAQFRNLLVHVFVSSVSVDVIDSAYGSKLFASIASGVSSDAHVPQATN